MNEIKIMKNAINISKMLDFLSTMAGVVAAASFIFALSSFFRK